MDAYSKPRLLKANLFFNREKITGGDLINSEYCRYADHEKIEKKNKILKY